MPMQIQINAAGVEASDALRTRVHQELEDALRLFHDRVMRVEVHLRDLNGTKGGVDKHCLFEVRLAGQPPLAVEADGGDFFEAVTIASGRLERAVRHKLDRRDER